MIAYKKLNMSYHLNAYIYTSIGQATLTHPTPFISVELWRQILEKAVKLFPLMKLLFDFNMCI